MRAGRWGLCDHVARLQRLKRLLGPFLSRRPGMVLLQRVQARHCSEADGARVRRILRATLRLPEAPGHEPSAPAASAARRWARHTS